MFLSFIVPVYNVEKYLEECLDSLLDQDVDKSEYEIVCVNDGSTDGSPEILARYAQRYPNIRIVTKENGGLAAARNTGLEHAVGEYVWYIDSDDFIQQNVLGRIRELAEQTACDRIYVDTYEFFNELSEEEKAAKKEEKLEVNCRKYNINVWNNVFRLAHLKEHGLYFHPELRYAEDVIYMLEFTFVEYQEQKFDKVCYYYRQRANSLMTNASLAAQMNKIAACSKIHGYYMEYYNKGLGEPAHLADKVMANLWHLLSMVVNLPASERRKVMRQLKRDKVFPFKRLEACTIMKSYQTTRNDLIGKMFDKAYINMHQPWGFAAMKMLQTAIRLKHSLRK